MKCPNCNGKLKRVNVVIAGTKSKAVSHQCTSCDYFSFDPRSSKKVLQELHNTPLKLKQRIIKLSGNRLGIYFGKDLVESLGIKKGEDIYVTVPDKNHIILELRD